MDSLLKNYDVVVGATIANRYLYLAAGQAHHALPRGKQAML
jgi:hypothetical protein